MDYSIYFVAYNESFLAYTIKHLKKTYSFHHAKMYNYYNIPVKTYLTYHSTTDRIYLEKNFE